MKIFRIVPKEFAEDPYSGIGGLHASARWHTKGRRIVYTSQSAALSALEILANAKKDWQPSEHLIIPAEILSNVKIVKASLKGLKGKWWQTYPRPPKLRDIGDKWLKEGKSVAVEVPSAVMPIENNYLLNPEHADFAKIKIGKPIPFSFDFRIINAL